MDAGTLITKQIKDDKGYKAMIFCGWTKKGKDIARYVAEFIQEQYPEVTATYSEGVVEITPRDCYKANGLALICEKGNINPDDVYVVGDSGNDISMFNAFYEHSFCMRHAPEHVRCHAKYTIKKFNHLEKYLK